jgi:hypothetical protein
MLDAVDADEIPLSPACGFRELLVVDDLSANSQDGAELGDDPLADPVLAILRQRPPAVCQHDNSQQRANRDADPRTTTNRSRTYHDEPPCL